MKLQDSKINYLENWMIKIKRSNSPKRLVDNPDDIDRYNHEEVVSELWEMQYEKCCYCEMSLPENGHLKAVEHFKPKSIFTGHVNQWSNLLLACSQCNGAKSNKYPIILSNSEGDPAVIYMNEESQEQSALIDPSDDNINPEEHIEFNVDDDEDDWGLPINLTVEGKETIEVTGISNRFFVKKRRTYYREVLYEAYMNLLTHRDSRNREALTETKSRFESFLSSNHEFAGFARSFARKKHKPLNELGINIP